MDNMNSSNVPLYLKTGRKKTLTVYAIEKTGQKLLNYLNVFVLQVKRFVLRTWSRAPTTSSESVPRAKSESVTTTSWRTPHKTYVSDWQMYVCSICTRLVTLVLNVNWSCIRAVCKLWRPCIAQMQQAVNSCMVVVNNILCKIYRVLRVETLNVTFYWSYILLSFL